FFLRSHSEGRRRAEEMLASPSVPRISRGRAAALLTAAFMTLGQGDRAAVSRYGEESAALWRGSGENARAGLALAVASTGAQPDYATARGLANEGLRLVRESGDGWWSASACSYAGYAALLWGDTETAQVLIDESIGRYRALGDEWWG